MIRSLSVFLALPGLMALQAGWPGTVAPWPETGPPLVLAIDSIGNGYSSPAVTSDRIYVTGETGKTGIVKAFTLDGVLVWESTYGEEFTVSFPGSRAAPLAVDSLLYVVSGNSDLTCFDNRTGVKIWSVSMTRQLGGIMPIFGYSMGLLTNGEKLYCSPSGEKNNVVALNRFTGELVWSSPAMGEPTGYGAPLLIELPGRKLLVTASEYHILGLDADTGELLWSYELAFKGDVPCNTPVFDGKRLYWIAGPGNGAVAADLNPDGTMEVVWKNMEFDTSFGDFVRIGKWLYGSSSLRRKYLAVDCETGNTTHSLAFGTGSLTTAADCLIAYNQQGKVGLIRPGDGRPSLLASFPVTRGTAEHFSHPVVSGNRLYVRHGDCLLAWKID